jgi:hypothetical protein
MRPTSLVDQQDVTRSASPIGRSSSKSNEDPADAALRRVLRAMKVSAMAASRRHRYLDVDDGITSAAARIRAARSPRRDPCCPPVALATPRINLGCSPAEARDGAAASSCRPRARRALAAPPA